MKRHKQTILSRLRNDVQAIVVVGGVVIMSSALIVTSRSFQFFGGEVSHVKTSEKVVALTFDDGPVPGNINRVLDTLDTYHVSATFFLLGKEIDSHPEIAMEIAGRGHELGNHSYSHRSMVFMPPGRMQAEIELTDAAIREAGYNGTIHFRPPYGHKFIALPWYLHEHHRPTILWNIAPDDDATRTSPEEIAETVERQVTPGSIIVMHIMEDHREPSRRALKLFIPKLQKEGYRFVTISELLHD